MSARTALAALLIVAAAGCGGGVGTMPVRGVMPTEDPASLGVETVCARDLSAMVVESETEIIITLDGDRTGEACASTLVVILDAPAGNRFVRDGANGTVFGWAGTEYVQVSPAPNG